MINTGTLKIAKIVKGDTFKETLTFYDSAGDPMDLTGYTIYMALKASPDGAGTAAININSTAPNTQGSIVISTNVVTITIFDTATDTLTASSNQLSYLDPKMQEMLINNLKTRILVFIIETLDLKPLQMRCILILMEQYLYLEV